MKKLILSVALMFALSNASLFANKNIGNPSIINNGIDDRDVKNFNGVAAGGPITVIITLGSTEGLRFEGDEDAIATLISEVKGGALIIRPQTSWTSWAHKYANKKIVAYVSAKTIKSLTMSGDGSMTVKGKINGGSLAATLSGSGSIAAQIDVDSFNGVVSGSGKLAISGSAQDANVTLSGSGSLTKSDFSTSKLNAVISGSGSITVNRVESIHAVISGSGNVNYTGNPTIEKTVFGSGRVRKI